MSLHFGFCFGTALRSHVTQDELWPLLETVERCQYDSFWFYNDNGDAMPPALELAKEVAHRTSSLRFGPHALVAPGLLEKTALARELYRLHQISSGRFVAQLGIGGARELLMGDQRGAAAELERILREIATDPTGAPRPFPVWLGGNRDRTVKRVAALADGWVPAFITPAEYRRRAGVLRGELDRLGRRTSVTLAVQVVYLPPSIDTPRVRAELDAEVAAHRPGAAIRDLYAIGGYRAVRARVAEFAETGVEHVILVPARPVPDWKAEIIALKDEVINRLRNAPATRP